MNTYKNLHFTSMGDYSIGYRIVVDQPTGMDDGIILSKQRQLKKHMYAVPHTNWVSSDGIVSLECCVLIGQCTVGEP